MLIEKGHEYMTSKERVRAVLHREKPDRVPINYHSNPGIDSRLKKAFGLSPDDNNGLRNALGVDFRRIKAEYIGSVLHTGNREDRFVDPLFGIVRRRIEHASGYYMDYCDFPLKDADVKTVNSWALPNPDDYNYAALEQQLKQNEGYAIHLGDSGQACIINNAGFLRGMEQVFIDLITDDEAGLLLIDRWMELQLKVLERELDFIDKLAKKQGKRTNELVDFIWMGEDLGTQHTPLISMELFKKHILPRQKPFFDLCKSYDLPTLLHTCGSSSWAYEEYIKVGLTGVDTLQPEAANMSPEYLKEHFSGRLFFHGCISTTGPLAFGNTKDTIDDCKNILEIMMPGYEYCFAPTHSMQDNTPVENVIAAYNTAHKFGRY